MKENFDNPDPSKDTFERVSLVAKKYFSRLNTIILAGYLLGNTGTSGPIEAAESAATKTPAQKLESKKEPDTEAEKILREFPLELPGISARVQRESVAGAKKVFVVINQIHLDQPETLTAGIKEKATPADVYWELDTINQGQQKVEKVIDFLSTRYKLDEIFTEGVSEQTLENDRQAIKTDFSSFTETKFSHYVKFMTNTLPGFPVSGKELAKRFPHVTGAPLYLFSKGKVNILPGENEAIMQKMTAEIMAVQTNSPDSTGFIQKHHIPPENRHKWDVIFEERENHLVQMVGNNRKTVSAAVWGKAHYWEDNVERWNKANPNNKIGLVVINPEYVNESFLSALLSNSGFPGQKNSWIEFHIRDFIEKIEKEKIYDDTLFDRGFQEMRKFSPANTLSEEDVLKVMDIVKRAAKEKLSGLHELPRLRK